jgi:hypothetical protein
MMKTVDQRLDELDARCVAHGVALEIILQSMSPAVRAAIASAAEGAVEQGLPLPVSDTHLENIAMVLRLLVQRS